MNFVEFNQFSNKNKPLTVKEMFAKCLMKIQGVSQEKAIAIVKVYPTPAL
jgi:crossover junction endonuclease MUS81